MLNEFKRHISSPYYGEDLERINQIEKGLELTTKKNREEADK